MFSAAILAGGQAARFGGRDKSALVVDGRGILDRQLVELSAATADVMLVGSPRSCPAPARAVADLVSGSGPLGGVHAALVNARYDAVFIVACDMPFVTAALASYLVSLAAAADIVVPRTERGYHPLCAVYARACVDAVTRRLGARRLKMTDLFGAVRTRVVAPAELVPLGGERLLANVNTPAEFADLEALRGHKL